MKTFLQFTIACATALLVAVSPGSLAQTSHADDVYQGLGGKEGIRKVVDTFLPIVLEDARINQAFKDADIERLGMLLAEQFCELSGGPCKYSGKDMKTAHAAMAITNAQFNALAEDLQTAMDKQGIASRVQNKLIAKLAPMQRDVVTK